ncbi:hypothetical protein EDD11_007585 [Mortierella claussenii]|nr:hypothetical protein EDD11_007585 [Mortierella claussenii]
MSTRAALESTSTSSLLHSTAAVAATTTTTTTTTTTGDTLGFTDYSPRSLQACLDSTIMTYLRHQQQHQQQQQSHYPPHHYHQPPPMPPHALSQQQQKQQQQQLQQQQQRQQQHPQYQMHQQQLYQQKQQQQQRQHHFIGADTVHPQKHEAMVNASSKTITQHPLTHHHPHLVHPATATRARDATRIKQEETAILTPTPTATTMPTMLSEADGHNSLTKRSPDLFLLTKTKPPLIHNGQPPRPHGASDDHSEYGEEEEETESGEGDSFYDDEDDDDDDDDDNDYSEEDSEYSQDEVDESDNNHNVAQRNRNGAIDSGMVDSEGSDYESDSDRTQAKRQHLSRQPPAHTTDGVLALSVLSQGGRYEEQETEVKEKKQKKEQQQEGNNVVSHDNSAQRLQLELVRQMTMAAGVWSLGGHRSSNSSSHGTSSISISSKSNSNSVSHSQREGSCINGDSFLANEDTLSVEEDEDDEDDEEEGHDSIIRPISRHATTRRSVTTSDTAALLDSPSQRLQVELTSQRLDKARMVPYIEDDDEEEEDEDDYDDDDDYEGTEEYDEDEEEYSYSEDDGEEDDEDEEEEEVGSFREGHYGGARDDPSARIAALAAAKGRTAQPAHYSRSIYHHYRPPRLDENYLQKRAITKHVVRRSSLTALLGEASQPELEPRDRSMRPAAMAFGGGQQYQHRQHQQQQQQQQQRYHNHHHQRDNQHVDNGGRRPSPTGIWSEGHEGKFIRDALSPLSAVSKEASVVGDQDSVKLQTKVALDPRVCMGHVTEAAAEVVVVAVSSMGSVENDSANSSTQGSHRPRRTDSGVEVKLSPHQHRDSASSDSSSSSSSSSGNNGSDSRKISFGISAEMTPVTSSDGHSSVAEMSPGPSLTLTDGQCSRIKSEDDVPEQECSLRSSSSVEFLLHTATEAGSSSSANVSSVNHASASGSNSAPVSFKPLKSSISCHTFPRSAGKRVGQPKHVSWHHSLFPTERVLRVKPSLPSLSSVAIESANATLSQLPSVPVMTRDKVEGFHQSIRSLRTLSRIEIAKMSYKQQGRQELTSTVPISKSGAVNDSVPWWNPARWIRGTVTIDKRHWKWKLT